MKKSFLVLTIVLGGFALLPTAIFAQNVAPKVISVTLNKANHEAVSASYEYSNKVLNTVLSNKIKESNLGRVKSASNKFKVLKGVTWTAISNDKMDYYYKISGNKRNSTLEMLASKGYDNFLTQESNATVIQNIQTFVTSLNRDLYIYKVGQEVLDKQKDLKKLEKNLKSKQKNVKESKKDIKKAQDAVEQQQSEIGKLKSEIEQLQGQQ